MVLSHQKFYFEGKCLIEKLSIRAPYRFTANFHNQACFIYFREGQTKITSPDEQQIIRSGESVLLNCGNYFADLLNYHDAKAFEILAFHLYTDSLKKIYADEIPYFIKKPDNKEFIYKVASVDVIRKFVESLYFYFDNPGLVNDELLKLKIKELILLLMQTSNAQSIIALFSNLFTPRLLNVKDVVNSHLFSDLSINDLAKLCNLSVSTFNRTFQDMFDDTPASYIKTKRLERAKELLLVSSLSVSEIAFQTCFNDAAHFSRSFKTAYTCSPTEFRLLQKTGKA